MKTIITLTGPTCSGKTTIEKLLQSQYKLEKFISSTTRLPRPDEVNNKDYYFITPTEFKHRLDDDDFIEYIYTDNNSYGLLKEEVDNLGVIPGILVCNPEGTLLINNYCKHKGWKHISIYLIIDTVLQSTRFFDRDVLSLVNEPLGIKKCINRLAHMLHDEQNWIKSFNYDKYIKVTDDNTEEVLKEIIQLI